MVDYRSCLENVRKHGNAELVAVSKMHGIDSVMEAYEQGARIFGENRVQEAESKFRDRPCDMKLYIIGHLQSNKVRKAVAIADRIESVDSVPLLERIESECARIDKTIEILLEYNSSKEENKSGFLDPEDLIAAARLSLSMPHIKLRGIMTVGPLGFDEKKNAEAFSDTKHLFDRIREITDADVLSMGMSSDWKQALEYGSTEVRIGTAIFGERDYTA